MSTLEIIASLLGALCVGLLIRRNHWSWPIGFVQVVLMAVVLWKARLYAETGLQVVFAVLQLYGWWAWLASVKFAAIAGDEKSSEAAGGEIVVRRLSGWRWLAAITSTLIGTAMLYAILVRWTDGQAPSVDAFIAAASLVAQALLAWRYLENWYFWIVVDLVSIPLYGTRGMYALALLYVVFLVMAISGWWVWRSSLLQRNHRAEVAT